MNRRKFLKGFGQAAAMVGIAAAVPSAIIPVPAVIAAPQDPASNPEVFTQYYRATIDNLTAYPLLEGVAPYPLKVTFHRDFPAQAPVHIQLDSRITNVRWLVQDANHPSMHDPLGQFGYTSIKYDYDGKQYGDWIKISSELLDANYSGTIREAKAALVQSANEKIQLLNTFKRVA